MREVMMSSLPFSWAEWGKQDGLELAGHIRTGDVQVKEVMQQAVAAINRVNPALNGVLEVFNDIVADPAIGAADPKDGLKGLLYGVPLLLKDQGARLKGRLHENGSALFRGHIATTTDPFISHLLSAGLIPLGRSTTAEMGLAWDTTTTYLGDTRVTRNPYNLSRTPGGSSGGSAAMVASGAVPVASSSDGGGSTRIPAAHCGLVGLKVTRGLCPRPFDSSEYISRISGDGVLTRSVRDTAAILDYTARVAPGGSFMPAPSRPSSYLDLLAQPAPTLRIAFSQGQWGRDAVIDDGIAAKMHEMVQLVLALKHIVKDCPEDMLAWHDLWESYTTNWMSARGQLDFIMAQRGESPDALADYLTPMVFRMYEASQKYDKFDIWRMMQLNNGLTRAYGALFEHIDVLITPCYAKSVPLANGDESTLRDSDVGVWFDRQLDAARFALLANEVGAPAISIPVGTGEDGLPVGIQLCGRWGDEARLLQLAADIERAQPHWFGMTPKTHVANMNDASFQTPRTLMTGIRYD